MHEKRFEEGFEGNKGGVIKVLWEVIPGMGAARKEGQRHLRGETPEDAGGILMVTDSHGKMEKRVMGVTTRGGHGNE